MDLLGTWGDKETINALTGGLIALAGALGLMAVRVMRQRTTSRVSERESEAAIVERMETRTNGELSRMLDTAMGRIDHLEDELRERDRRHDRLQSRVSECESQRAAQAETILWQNDTIAWMKRMLKKAGLISDDDDAPATGRAVPKKSPNNPEGGR